MRRIRAILIRMGAAFAVVIALLAIADAVFPLDMTRAETLSREVRAREGTLLRPFLASDDSWRLLTEIADVHPRYLEILTQYEDRRFYSHLGVDPLAVMRAAYQWWNAGEIVSGASTLAMQVARLLEPGQSRGLLTKFKQSARALQLELHYSKEEILGLYLTLAPFGGNLEGVRAASLAYFGKEPSSLTLSEAALLVAIPQSPERVRPDRDPYGARQARDKVLDRLLERGVIGADEAEEAHNSAVPMTRLAMPMAAPHFAERLARTGGGTITVSTIDAGLQRALAALTEQEAYYFDDDAGIAVVVVRTDTREVLAEIGGTDYWGTAGQVDLASAPRSPGSTLKSFIYGMAFDDLSLHPATVMEDVPTAFGDYTPQNFGGGFSGAVTARDALRMSLNVPAVATLERVGPLRFTENLRNAGATLVFPRMAQGPSLPVALGGVGISLRDLTMLYAGLADGGTARALHETLNSPEGEAHRLFGPAAAYYVRDILTGASLPVGWAMGQGLNRGRTIGFKTGTSFGYRDAWAVGFSNDYTVGVWVGVPSGTPRAGRVGKTEAGPILLKVFDLLPADRHAAPTPPPDVINATRTEQLPVSMRRFVREERRGGPAPSRIQPPAISFPLDGTTVSLDSSGAESAIQLSATGGRAPLTWLVDGAVVGSFDLYQRSYFTPAGEGLARITVVDADGRSASARVRFKNRENF
jgi:penicillin-binding protein 1C